MASEEQNNPDEDIFEKPSTVFFAAVALCGVLAIWGIISPDSMTGVAMLVTSFLLENLDWFFLLLCAVFLGINLYLAFGPYAHLKLGKEDDKPEFSTPSWLAMLFAAGMGSGLLFWGVAEPMYHFMEPPGMQGGTPEAARMAMVITNFHWAFHAWGIYAIASLVLAYFGFRKGEKYLPSSPICAVFQGKRVKVFGHFADVIAVLSVVFGVAGSLAMGISQLAAGIDTVIPLPVAPDSQVVVLSILALVTVSYLISASTSLDKGIQILSNINMIAAICLLLFILFFGPTRFMLEIMVTTLGDYISNLFAMSFRVYPYQSLQGWSASWTLTYLVWWIAWGPFVGIFIARISKGRTIRQFVIGVLFVPSLFSIIWFSVFGGAGFDIELFRGGGFGDLVRENVTTALFALFEYYPFTLALKVLALFLLFVFLVTSADSATFVIGMMTSHGALDPSSKTKMTWGLIIAALTASTLMTGGTEVAKAIAISGAIPFSVILIIQIVAFLKALREEPCGNNSQKSGEKQ